MESVRDAIACKRDFMSCSIFDPWEGVSCGDRSAFVAKYSAAFDTYLSRKKSDAAKQLHSANREPRHVRFSDSGGSGTSSSCNSPRAAMLPKSSFALASPRSGSDSGTLKQRTYTAESSLAAILGKRKEDKCGNEKSVSAAKESVSKKCAAKEPAKGTKKDVQKSPKVTRSQSSGGSKSG